MKTLQFFVAVLLTVALNGQSDSIIKLSEPSKVNGKNIMEVFANWASVSEFDIQELNFQEIADLLWATNGINRPA